MYQDLGVGFWIDGWIDCDGKYGMFYWRDEPGSNQVVRSFSERDSRFQVRRHSGFWQKDRTHLGRADQIFVKGSRLHRSFRL